MKLSRDTLLAALDLPAKITDSHILISSADGGFYINASDGDQTYITSIEGKAKDEIAPVCVNAKTLMSAVQCGLEEIELNNGATFISYASGTQKLKIPTIPPDSFKSLQFDGNSKLLVVPADLMAKGIKLSKFTAPESSHREVAKAVHVVTSATRLICESMNGTESNRYSVPAICGEADFLIPSDFAAIVSRVLQCKDAEVLLNENTITIKTQFSRYTCKLMDGKYMNMEVVYSRPSTLLGVIARDEWLEAFQCMKLLGDGRTDVAMNGVTTLKSGEYARTIEGNMLEAELHLNSAGFMECLSVFPAESLLKLSVASDGSNLARLEDGELQTAVAQLRA